MSLIDDEYRGAIRLEDIANLERKGLEHLLQHTLERLVVAQLSDIQELRALFRYAFEQADEVVSREVGELPGKLTLAVVLRPQRERAAGANHA